MARLEMVRLQCPACGAPIAVANDSTRVTCAYCGVRLATVIDGDQFAVTVAAEVHKALQAAQQRPLTLPPVAPPAPAALGHSNGRGCLFAALMWFVVGPLLTTLLLAPFIPLFPMGETGESTLPGPVGLCVLAIWVGLTVYAFLYFRRRENGIMGFIAEPVRRIWPTWLSARRP